ncbi:hypothetical protein [Micromonospora rubida]|uniref:hypothetical protein n=1 Tax=Micromonospora rubida TaxID=2697657 RepID=UPI00191C20F6|nr:hypothetical protein [Micromonospora rubida]
MQNLSVDLPATAKPGGGLATTLTVPLPCGQLSPGESVNIALTVAVDVGGTFWFGCNVDAPGSSSASASSRAARPAPRYARTTRPMTITGGLAMPEAKGQA